VTHRRLALLTVLTAMALDAVFGIAFGFVDHVGPATGLYFATTTATTVGYGDILPRGWLPHLLAVLIMLTVVPLFAATFSLFTSALGSVHLTAAERRLNSRIDAHHAALRTHFGIPPPGGVPADTAETGQPGQRGEGGTP
jgi:voltage-gated potassium channel Kch